MIAYPITPDQVRTMREFVRAHALTQPTDDMQCIGWFDPATEKLLMVAAMNGFMGRICNIHIAMVPGFHFTPKAMLREVFAHAFDRLKLAKLVGLVNSNNTRAMRYDLHLGFVEEHRMPGMHDDGGDLVILSMTRAQCRYLNLPALLAA